MDLLKTRGLFACMQKLKNLGFDIRVSGGEEVLGRELPRMLEQCNFLQLFGSFKENEFLYNSTVRLVQHFTNGLPGQSDQERETIVNAFNSAATELAIITAAAEEAELELRRMGCRYDPIKRIVVSDSGRKGRPEQLIGPAVWCFYSKKYRGEQNTRTLREKIARDLSYYLDEEFLDPRSNGPISKAIQNRENL